MSDLTGQKATSGNLRGVLSEIHPVFKIDTELNKEGYAAESKATGDAINVVREALTTHESNKNNPHGVTAEQVGARPNTWLPTIEEIGAASAANLNGLYITKITVAVLGSVRFRVNGQFLMMGRLNTTANSSNSVYVLTGYNDYRSPTVTQLSAGTSVTVSVGGDNNSGWYVEVKNAQSNATTSLVFIGAGAPNVI